MNSSRSSLLCEETGDRIASFSAAQPFEVPAISWPDLGALDLTQEQLAERLLGVGGSDANTVFSGDPSKVRNLWLEKRGGKTPEDLSGRLAVSLGSWTESFNRQWYERLTGQTVQQIGSSRVCPRHEWRRCTLDGFIEESNSVWEAKHTSAFARSDEVLERYMPQLQHNMAVAGVERAILSVIFGNHKFEMFEVASDWIYQIELLEAEIDFWDCVRTGREPVAAPQPTPPNPVGVREVCLEGNNCWAAAAADWLAYREAAKIHSAACSHVKELVESD
ncbi:MAG TPA: YqaJ viral recombinase family protein, partial [Sphingomicrobium sp.]|nr:YqaJ viral recombinase family protein [Sphingomicrobium sp.]